MAQAKSKAKTAEKNSTAKRNMPWSIKGVSTEARDAARAAVEASGGTMGEWLGEAIRAVAAEERGVAEMPDAMPIAPEMPPETLEPLAERIAAAERRTALMVAPLHELLETIARRLEGLESRLPSSTVPSGESRAAPSPSGDTPAPDSAPPPDRP
ncbi:MAG: hypothetical protein QUV20_05845 [Oceanibaculum nanhaiense]|uniref:hypothetical protein n=1 Tax=Oceanibaculum nanhaiense TaxID=1909734 RepID=UPI0025A4B1E3|nr:hypothetical protein [Oceanibaculum nanhaiense]MDM7945839.1 hypothetical protein [Oceanibaculum nanhaiense]